MLRSGGREDAILFVGSLFSSDDVFFAAEQDLREMFGTVLFKSPTVQWDYSDYYNSELRPPLLRTFLFFKTVVDPLCLVEAKLRVMEMEKKFSVNDRRQINIDPGYLTLAKAVLASTKNYSHRINLGRGVFAELELFFRQGRFNPMPYTYADYRDKRFLGFFATARELFKKSLEAEKKTH
jgi:hypothetical protein